MGVQGASFWAPGAISIGAGFDGCGVVVPRGGYPATWDQAGWCWWLVQNSGGGDTILVNQFPVFLDYPAAQLFDERFDTSEVFVRFLPVPWLRTYDIYSISLSRVP